MKKVETKIYKYGNSQAIILKKSILKEAQMSIGDRVHYYVNEQCRRIIEKKEKFFQE